MYYYFYPDKSVRTSETHENTSVINTICYRSHLGEISPYTIKIIGRWVTCTKPPDWVKAYVLLLE